MHDPWKYSSLWMGIFLFAYIMYFFIKNKTSYILMSNDNKNGGYQYAKRTNF